METLETRKKKSCNNLPSKKNGFNNLPSKKNVFDDLVPDRRDSVSIIMMIRTGRDYRPQMTKPIAAVCIAGVLAEPIRMRERPVA